MPIFLIPIQHFCSTVQHPRSAGTYLTPRSTMCLAEAEVTSSVTKYSFPLSILRMPANASASSPWPLPLTPAMPNICPSLKVKETPSTATSPLSFLTTKPSAIKMGLPFVAGLFFVLGISPVWDEPTIISANISGVFPGIQGADDLPSSQHGYPVGDLENFL